MAGQYIAARLRHFLQLGGLPEKASERGQEKCSCGFPSGAGGAN